MKRASSGGFTIVESMIVLGVTGVLFISLVGMVTAQQSKARFKSAMTDISTQIQSQINEVSTGYYPNSANFTCKSAAGVLTVTPAPAGTAGQGENGGCTFLGRALMYGIPNTDPEQYKIQTLIGSQKTLQGKEPSTIQEAGTRVLAPSTLPQNVTTDLSATWQPNGTTKELLYGTTVAWMRSRNGNGVNQPENIAGIAIVASPNQQISFNQNGAVESGTVIPSIIPIPYNGPVGGIGVGDKEGVSLLIQSLGLPATNPKYIAASVSDMPVDICFKSGTTSQSGLVTIGANNSTTSVEFVIYNSQDCT